MKSETTRASLNDETDDTNDENSTDETYSRVDRKFIEIKDRIIMHNGNITFFTITNGTPVDIGAKVLADNNKLPTITDATQ